MSGAGRAAEDENMLVDEEEALDDLLQDSRLVVVPGEEITRGSGFLRGHGTYLEAIGPDDDDDDAGPAVEQDEDGSRPRARLVASVAGVVLRVNRLVSVEAPRSRYSGDVGDVVVGRIVEVGNKQWKVDLGARQLGTLQLGSINLPGGALRRRTLEDQLQMRQLFVENDLVSAEVSSFYQHGGMAIHTRSMRYGKLLNGQLVTVPSSLMKRLSQHFVSLPCGVEAIFGLNGRIWLTSAAASGSKKGVQNKSSQNATASTSADSDHEMDAEDAAQQDRAAVLERSRMTELMEQDKRKHAERVIDVESRQAVARVRNAIVLLANNDLLVSPQATMAIYDLSLRLDISPMAMLAPDVARTLVEQAIEA
ncbi:Exosome complex component RRP4 [Hondaea fermentalgiana]|uniref:Exosome complex component RRP4 n=1 Tax=Hondaea fermentalgiana TaxID=2315210 RepID=A0A2R5GSR8_9STRA|nr:Exosome complex component RRP4 [Hondaea fermentalgiana]|eukprot:GBG33635.1 Exosome complex component RRP4 [Hondaea fermentalgiana]